MTVYSEFLKDKNQLIIRIHGQFNFSVYHDFQQSYETVQAENPSYVIDLQQTEYMDSSALGMLLVLREYAGNENADIRLINATPDIAKILEISNFHRLFKIEQ